MTLNARVAIACFSFALAVGVLSGLFPALRLSRARGEDLLERHSRGVSARSRLGKLLVALETGLAVVLVVGGSLMMNSFVRLSQVDLGFQPTAPAGWTLDVETTCLNRDLPHRLPFGGDQPRLQLTETGGPLAYFRGRCARLGTAAGHEGSTRRGSAC